MTAVFIAQRMTAIMGELDGDFHALDSEERPSAASTQRPRPVVILRRDDASLAWWAGIESIKLGRRRVSGRGAAFYLFSLSLSVSLSQRSHDGRLPPTAITRSRPQIMSAALPASCLANEASGRTFRDARRASNETRVGPPDVAVSEGVLAFSGEWRGGRRAPERDGSRGKAASE